MHNIRTLLTIVIITQETRDCGPEHFHSVHWGPLAPSSRASLQYTAPVRSLCERNGTMGQTCVRIVLREDLVRCPASRYITRGTGLIMPAWRNTKTRRNREKTRKISLLNEHFYHQLINIQNRCKTSVKQQQKRSTCI